MKALNEAIARGRRSAFIHNGEEDALNCAGAAKDDQFPVQTREHIHDESPDMMCLEKDEEMLQIWVPEKQNIEDNNKNEETAFETQSEKHKITSETKQSTSRIEKVVSHEDDFGAKHQNSASEIKKSSGETQSEEGEETGPKHHEISAGNQEMFPIDEDMLQTCGLKQQHIEDNNENRKTAFKTPPEKYKTASKSKENPAGIKTVMFHEDDEDLHQIWGLEHRNIESEIKKFSVETQSEGEEETDAKIWDPKPQTSENKNEHEEIKTPSGEEETGSKTQEINVGNQDMMCQTDEDMLQIWDPKHQNIDFEDIINETPCEQDKIGSEAKEIPSGSPKVMCYIKHSLDEDVHQIWHHKHQSIEEENEMKTTASEEEETSS